MLYESFSQSYLLEDLIRFSIPVKDRYNTVHFLNAMSLVATTKVLQDYDFVDSYEDGDHE